MRRYLIINSGVVVKIVDKDGAFDGALDFPGGAFDTVTDDFTNTYEVGETYDCDEWWVRNGFNTSLNVAIRGSKGELEGRARHFKMQQMPITLQVILPVLLQAQNSKALEIMTWLRSVWELLKIETTKEQDDPSYISSENFVSCGDCPYDIFEMLVEYDSIIPDVS